VSNATKTHLNSVLKSIIIPALFQRLVRRENRLRKEGGGKNSLLEPEDGNHCSKGEMSKKRKGNVRAYVERKTERSMPLPY